MLRIKLPKTIPPLEQDGNRNVSILKITSRDKFIIFKTVNIEWMIKEIKSTYGKFIRKGILETNLFYPLIKHIYGHETHDIKIEILLTTTDGYQALKFELEQLIKHFGTKECLNKNNVPHIPKTVVAKKGSDWLTQNEALNFRKLLTKYSY
jgi:hypothetical protein